MSGFVSLGAQGITLEQLLSAAVHPSATNIAKPGMLFVECLGASRTYMRDGSTYSSTPVYISTGIVKDLELRVASNGNPEMKRTDSTSTSGSGDRWAGLKWCALHDGILRTDMSFQYMHKFPTPVDKLGSGAPDDSLGLIFNRLGSDGSWTELNFSCIWLGRSKESGGGTIRQPSASFTLCRSFGKGWGLGGKLGAYGKTPMNPRMVTLGSFLSREICSQFYVSLGLDYGLNQDAPKYSAFLGVNFWLGPPGKKQ